MVDKDIARVRGSSYHLKVGEKVPLIELMKGLMIVSGNDPVENYKFIMGNYSSSPDEAMNAISQSFIEFIRKNYPQHNSKIPYIIISIAEYMSQLTSSPDRVVVLLACCFKLQTILKS